MTTHTPEPWSAQQDCRSWRNEGIFDGNNPDPYGNLNAWAIYGATRIAVLSEAADWLPQTEVDANAERIVACVNACAGINPTAVPALVQFVRDYVTRVNAILQRDESLLLGEGLAFVMQGRAALAATIDAKASLYKAAPAMFTALEALDQGFRDGSIKFTHKRTSDSDPYHPANVLMCEALAQARDENAA